MICKIDLNINLVKMALIIFISDEAIFLFLEDSNNDKGVHITK